MFKHSIFILLFFGIINLQTSCASSPEESAKKITNKKVKSKKKSPSENTEEALPEDVQPLSNSESSDTVLGLPAPKLKSEISKGLSPAKPKGFQIFRPFFGKVGGASYQTAAIKTLLGVAFVKLYNSDNTQQLVLNGNTVYSSYDKITLVGNYRLDNKDYLLITTSKKGQSLQHLIQIKINKSIVEGDSEIALINEPKADSITLGSKIKPVGENLEIDLGVIDNKKQKAILSIDGTLKIIKG